MGSAPASGVEGRALAALCVRQIRSLSAALVHAGVRREGAPNCSRGGCAPHEFQLHSYGLARLYFFARRIRRMTRILFCPVCAQLPNADALSRLRSFIVRCDEQRWAVEQKATEGTKTDSFLCFLGYRLSNFELGQHYDRGS